MGAGYGKQFTSTFASKSTEMSSSKISFVTDFINSDKVVIFSKSYCPYCILAKEQFQKVKHDYKCLELDQRDDGDEIQDALLSITGARTVPRVFINGKCIGGGTDVKKLYETGSLQKMLS